MCFTGCLFASFLTFESMGVYFVGRFTTGFGVGMCCFALPLYSSELATPAIRGIMGSLFQLMIVVGGLTVTVLLKSITDWRLGMMLPGFAGAIVALAVWLTPESPRFVMDKHGFDAGVATLRKVRKGDVDREARAMHEQSQIERAAGSLSYKELFAQSGLRRRVLIACYLQISQQATGVNAFLTYTTNIFGAAGVPKDQVGNYAIYFNMLMLAGCIVGLMLVDSQYGGRRSQLLAASVVMGPPLVIAGLANLLKWPSWIDVVALVLYGPAFQAAWGLIPWIYSAEIFAMNEKDKAVSLATCMNFTLNFVVTLITPTLLSWSSGATFILFGLLNASNFVFVYLCVRETKGLPLEEIPALFEKKDPRSVPTN